MDNIATAEQIVLFVVGHGFTTVSIDFVQAALDAAYATKPPKVVAPAADDTTNG